MEIIFSVPTAGKMFKYWSDSINQAIKKDHTRAKDFKRMVKGQFNSFPPWKIFLAFCHLLIFFKINFLEKFFQKYDQHTGQAAIENALNNRRTQIKNG